jgi:2,3-bisphosphoglycerate-dependent phosphoglycerate mutase
MNCLRIPNLLLFAALTVCFFSKCEKKTKVVTEIITVIDTVVVTTHDTIRQLPISDSSLVIFLIRHAETTGIGSNPSLSTKGVERANSLVEVLKNNSLDAVYSTFYNRTQETAKPIADANGLSLITYDAAQLEKFEKQLEKEQMGKRILVVGHSNTTPELLNLLIDANTYSTFNDTVYNNLFIVTKSTEGALVTHLTY